MKCDKAQLSALSDGDLGPMQAERVRAHVAGCAACARELTAIEELRTQLSSLPAPEGDDNWMALSRKLAEAAPAPRRSWRRWVLVPAFGVVLIAGTVWMQRSRGPSDDLLIAQAEAEFRGAEAQYQRALDKLEKVVFHARDRWPEERRREYDVARAALEAATEQCRKVARAQRADAEAEEVLFAAYRKQIHFYEEQLLK